MDAHSENRSEVQAWLKKAIPAIKFGDPATTKIKQFKIQGETALVTVYGSTGEILAQPNYVSAKPIKQFIAKDVWLKTAQGWKLKSRQILPEDTDAVTSKPGAVGIPTKKS